MFCPKCGSILKPKPDGKKTLWKCSCGYVKKDVEAVELKESMQKTEGKMGIVDDQEEKSLPLTEATCPKCKHGKAYYWMIQTRAGDEPETKFLKCEKCKHTWRDYS
ncbi:transcription factor S [Candidatus Woesearchaeota archaeon]|nr:MAG: transcription factor S [Candidatus Woesearchaeota archaeon]